MQNYFNNVIKPIPESIKSGEFLPIDSFITREFSGADTEILYQENLKTKPQDWYYRNNPVTYTVNERGYRTLPFDKIDWKESVVIFGCSTVFGVGVDDTDTISSCLSKLINRPVINLGVGASSITYSLHNSIILSSNYPTPAAVVQLWTLYDRTVYYYRDKVKNHGPWNIVPNNYMDKWTEEASHAQAHAVFASMISKQLWKNTRYYEASYFLETAECLGCDQLTILDKARDDMHFGPKTSMATAEKIANNLDI